MAPFAQSSSLSASRTTLAVTRRSRASSAAASSSRVASKKSLAPRRQLASVAVVVRAEEGEGEKKESAGGDFYNDERPLPPRTEMSDAYKKKLRDEYLSLGGSPNTAMGSNYFLWIGAVIGTLAVLSWLTGAI